LATITPTIRRPPVLTIPNQLTLGRLGLSFVLFALIAYEQWAWSLAVFLVAAFTDWLDGYLARTRNQTSALGRNLDPLVDKILTCGVFIFLLPLGCRQGWLAPWMVAVVVGRELAITSLRGYLETLGVSFGADWLGKLKMVLQCVAVVAVFVALMTPADDSDRTRLVDWTRDLALYGMVAATLLSGLQYLWKAVGLLRVEN
jgi:CDP-diacylglycerol--glycerol-3-phosphate 3-phosphatidyltransferase